MLRHIAHLGIAAVQGKIIVVAAVHYRQQTVINILELLFERVEIIDIGKQNSLRHRAGNLAVEIQTAFFRRDAVGIAFVVVIEVSRIDMQLERSGFRLGNICRNRRIAGARLLDVNIHFAILRGVARKTQAVRIFDELERVSHPRGVESARNQFLPTVVCRVQWRRRAVEQVLAVEFYACVVADLLDEFIQFLLHGAPFFVGMPSPSSCVRCRLSKTPRPRRLSTSWSRSECSRSTD